MSKLDFFQRLDIYDINGDTVSKKTFNAIKEIQEQNKILREALEFYADENNWELGKVHSFVEVCEQDHEWIDSFPPFRVTQLTGGKRAREALAKVDKQLPSSEDTI